MPTYEYRCKDCDESFDIVQAFTDPTLTECPSCGGSLKKVFGNVGITFKGSGFYKTDSRNGTGTKKADGDAGSSGSDKKSDASSDAKSSSSDSSSKDSGSKNEKKSEPKKDAKAPAKSEAKSA